MSLKHWRVLVTRPHEDALALVAYLAKHSVYASALPLLAFQKRALAQSQLQCLNRLDEYCAVIVVSKPAARFAVELLPNPACAAEQTAWFSVGAATAATLAECGITASYPAQGDDSEALLTHPVFQQAIAQSSKRVLILRGTQGRDWLALELKKRGIDVEFVALYERYLPTYPTGTLSARVKSENLNGLVVSSGQGLEHLIELADHDWNALRVMPLFVPSLRVAQLAKDKGAQCVINCQGANAEALLNALSANLPKCHR